MRTGRVLLPGKDAKSVYRPVEIARLLRDLQPDIIHVQQSPLSLTLLEFHYLRRLCAPRAKLAFLTWENLDLAGYRHLDSRLAPLLPRVYYKGLRVSDLAFVTSQDAGRILRGHGFDKPIAVVPWGTSPEWFARRDASATRTRLGLDAFTFAYFGRLVRDKGIDVLADALATIEGPWQLLVAGDGPERAQWQQRLASLGIAERVRFVPRVPHEAMRDYYHCADALVLPSLTARTWKEQFGRVLIEAMAAGVAVIGSDSGEIPVVIGDAGLVVPEGDADALASACRRMRDDEGFRTAAVSRGLTRVRQEYSWEVVAAKTREAYHQLGPADPPA